MQIEKMTIIRTVVLVLALVNQLLCCMGESPLPITDEMINEIITLGITIGSALWAWWKNNSLTPKAIAADNYLKSLKNAETENSVTTDI